MEEKDEIDAKPIIKASTSFKNKSLKRSNTSKKNLGRISSPHRKTSTSRLRKERSLKKSKKKLVTKTKTSSKVSRPAWCNDTTV